MTHFIRQFGYVPYGHVRRSLMDWRMRITASVSELRNDRGDLVGWRCEFPCPVRVPARWGTRPSRFALQFDHCHFHGWVRGLLCPDHNQKVGRLESVLGELQREGVTVDLGSSRYGHWISRCPQCAPAVHGADWRKLVLRGDDARAAERFATWREAMAAEEFAALDLELG